MGGLAKFYGNDYNRIFENISTYDCKLDVMVYSANRSILINANCTVKPPYSALEAFLAVARGNISYDGTVYTNIDWTANDTEAVKRTLEIRSYHVFPVGPNESLPANATTAPLCLIPCADDLPATSFDVLSVNYNPNKDTLSELFINYDWNNFKNLTIHSTYSYLAFYSDIKNKLEWRYLLGQYVEGKFNLQIKFDKPPNKVTCEREEGAGTGEFNCTVSKLDEQIYNVKGFASGLDRLIVLW